MTKYVRSCDSQLVHCSLEQWDIYKLDPNYDCLVQHPPKLTIITPRKHNEFNSSSQSSTQSQSQSQSYSKRQPSPPSSDSEAPRGAPSKKRRGARIPEIDTDDEDEVAEMILDEPPNETKTGGRRERLETMNENRKIRREKITQRKRQNTEDDLLMRDLSLDDIPIPGASSSASPSTTANGDESPTTFSFTKRSWDDDTEERKKRVRTDSPLAAKEHLAAKRTERERMRRMKEQERIRRWKESRDQIFMQNLFHTYTSTANGGHSYSNGMFIITAGFLNDHVNTREQDSMDIQLGGVLLSRPNHPSP